ncbi:hypothetical protein RFI_01971 [Reticulomyxa filosa]|uniref:Uncharacterized protein n=1 Tax=Reticulomyxa filosa TaxID=46433 RepID=X6PAE7_RETFI|nr:hypothetical protein RFI_01971 [Reticulomyxa filosa]|eukprot:ETO35103.1 hypothetical protein RFI_01971 [Reticulomyxa filosa]
MSTKLNDKQLNRVFSAFIYELKDTNKWDRGSYAKSLVINALMSGLKDKGICVCISRAQSLGVFSTNLNDKQLEGNEKQSERIFNALIFVSKHSINTNNDRRLVELLELISTKLNDKQLYLLVIYLLERAKKKCEWGALPKISEDMWKHTTICGLKEYMQVIKEQNIWQRWFSNVTKNKIVDFRFDDIQSSYSIELYCDEQAIEWKFPTHQLKWNNSNEHRQTPLHLAINHQYWDITRYCIEQGAY